MFVWIDETYFIEYNLFKPQGRRPRRLHQTTKPLILAHLIHNCSAPSSSPMESVIVDQHQTFIILGLWVWVQGGYIRLDQNIADLSSRKQLYLEFYPGPRQNYIPQSNSYMMVNAFSRTVQLVTQCKVDLPRFMLPGKITVSYIDQGRTCECKIFWNTLLMTLSLIKQKYLGGILFILFHCG